MIRFAQNCQARKKNFELITCLLSASELRRAENYCISLVQKEHFGREIGALKSDASIPSSSPLVPPILLSMVMACSVSVAVKPTPSDPMMHGTLSLSMPSIRLWGSLSIARMCVWIFAAEYITFSSLSHRTWAQPHPLDNSRLCDLSTQIKAPAPDDGTIAH